MDELEIIQMRANQKLIVDDLGFWLLKKPNNKTLKILHTLAKENQIYFYSLEKELRTSTRINAELRIVILKKEKEIEEARRELDKYVKGAFKEL